ncbi:MAG: alpha/beta fold hydrolase [Leptospiraceae bacterium]|nr:alpha/beta fold hydrolase [Leptospiraceae bacterium]
MIRSPPMRGARAYRIVCVLALSGLMHFALPFMKGLNAQQQDAEVLSGDFEERLRVSGLERSFRLHVPATYYERSAAVPLVVVIHGAYSSGAQIAATSAFSPLADQNRFLVAYPNSIAPRGGIAAWNAGGCCGFARDTHVRDSLFLRRMIAWITEIADVDPGRIYVVGYSNGGMMAYRMACQYPDLFSGIAVVAGSREIEPCELSHAMSLMVVHGTADRNVPYGGGRGSESPFSRSKQSVRSSMRPWLRRAGCLRLPILSARADLTVRGCQDPSGRTQIRLFSLIGGRHVWPPSVDGVPTARRIFEFLEESNSRVRPGS